MRQHRPPIYVENFLPLLLDVDLNPKVLDKEVNKVNKVNNY